MKGESNGTIMLGVNLNPLIITYESKMHTIPSLITLRSTTFNFPSYNWLHNDNQYSFRQS